MSEDLQDRAKREGWARGYTVICMHTGLPYVCSNGVWHLQPIDREPLPYWKNQVCPAHPIKSDT